MGLFKIPKRKETNIEEILIKSKEEYKPKIKLKGTSLLDKLSAINRLVQDKLGEDAENYLLLDSDEKFLEYCRKAQEAEYIAIDTETTGLDTMLVDLVGVCLYSPNQKPAYAPVGHISAITETKLVNQVSIEAITKGFEMLTCVKQLYHNSYYDRVIIYRFTGIMPKVEDDTLIMGWYLNENEPHGLKYLYDKYCAKSGEIDTFSSLFEGIPFCYISPKVGLAYAAKDGYMTYKVWEVFKPYLTASNPLCKECGLERASKVYEEVEKPMLDTLIKMKLQGVKFDFNRANELREKYTKLKQEAEDKFNEAVKPLKKEILDRQLVKGDISYPINYNSPQQLKVLIYEILKSGTIFRKSPQGTGREVMDEILNNKKYENTTLYNIAEALQEVKKYDKLIGGFIDKLSEDAKLHNGRIFCDFNQVGCNTLRMSSNNPNLQNVPNKNDDIRNMFVADDGYVMGFLDFSQQEMMAVASLADDEKMLEAFHLGRDIYSHVASIAFKMPYEDCLEFNSDGTTNKEGKGRRKKAKAICLGICYGKGVNAIAEDLHITHDEAQEVKDSVLGAFPQLAKYLKNVVEFGKKHGYVYNFFGCKRRLPALQLPEYEISFKYDIDDGAKDYYKSLYLGKLRNAKFDDTRLIIDEANSRGIIIKDNGGLIAQETRNAYNSPVQSTAAILTKIAMNNISNNEYLNKIGAKLILTIHDEVSLLIPVDKVSEAMKIAEVEFLSAGKDLKADLRCDKVVSKCWAGEELDF